MLEDRADHDPQVKCLLSCLQTYKHEVCKNNCSYFPFNMLQAYERFVSARPNATEKTRPWVNRLSTPKNQA